MELVTTPLQFLSIFSLVILLDPKVMQVIRAVSSPDTLAGCWLRIW